MIVYLPRNLASLSRLAARTEHTRFGATNNLHVLANPNGLYRAEATDGHRLVIVQGPFDAAREPYDWLPADWQDDDGDTFVPRELWDQAFKIPDSLRGRRPVGVATTAGGGLVLGCEGSKFAVPPEERGRWPDVSRVLPKRRVLFAIRFNPQLVMDVLKLAAALHEVGPWVELLYFGKNVPFGLITSNSEGQAMDALVVPLTQSTEESK